MVDGRWRMADRRQVNGIPKGNPIWKQGLGALAVVVVAVLALASFPAANDPQVLGTPTYTPTPTATHTPTPFPTATLTPTPSPVPTDTPIPTATQVPTPTPTPTREPAGAHLWLAFPIGPDSTGDRYPGGYFPYGATGGGKYHLHHGVDYQNVVGTSVLAAAAGTVRVAGSDRDVVYGLKANFYGNLVVEELDGRFQGQPVYLLYGHLSEVTARVGQHVEPGDRLGLVGSTGVAIGPHLHLEVRLGANRYETTRNPVLWLKPEPGQGLIAGLIVDASGKPIPEVPVTFFHAAQPNKWWRQIQTYANQEVNPDDELGENFALGYVPAGDYLVKVKRGEKSYVRPVTVIPGQIAFVRIQTEK